MKYPYHPGSKGINTSAQAAEAAAERAPRLRGACLEVFRSLGPLSADQVAQHLGESVLAVRPRIAELHLLGKINDSGQRVMNRSGRTAAVWMIREPLEQLSFL